MALAVARENCAERRWQSQPEPSGVGIRAAATGGEPAGLPAPAPPAAGEMFPAVKRFLEPALKLEGGGQRIDLFRRMGRGHRDADSRGPSRHRRVADRGGEEAG